tara:strand:- start:608 stop:820 length:213 start_codon:yes stop_codon:yes gene_type:complete
MRKVLDSLVVASFLMSAAVLGSGVYGYFWITNEDTQKELMDSAVEKIKESISIPGLPKSTGGVKGPKLPF